MSLFVRRFLIAIREIARDQGANRNSSSSTGQLIMMRPLVFACLVLIAVVPLAAQNLVSNASFDSSLSGWQEKTNTDHFTWDPSESRSGGGGSALLFAMGSSTTIEAVQCISGVNPGATYRLSGSMMFPLFDNNGVGEGTVGFRGYTGASCNGSVTFAEGASRSTASKVNWLDEQTEERMSTTSTQSIEVYLRLTTPSGTFATGYFDDIALFETAPPAPTSSIDILGPTDVSPGRTHLYGAVGTDCTGNVDFGWDWTVSGGFKNEIGADTAWIHFPNQPGTVTITATNPNCGSATGTKTVTVDTSGANVTAGGYSYMYQPEGTTLGRSSFVVTNWGDEATTITLDQSEDFFTQSPTSFTLEPGERQRVSYEGTLQPLGLYRGRTFINGPGVSPYLADGRVVKLFVFDPDDPYGQAEPLANRIDTIEDGQLFIPFQNSDPFSSAIGYIVTDVRWIIPPEDTVEILPGETVDIPITIDRSLRPDADAPLGSVFGEVLFTQPGPDSAGKLADASPRANTNATTSLVTVVDTAPPDAEIAGIPALGPGEIALFIPGAGHVVGSVGTFISDLSVVNRDFFEPLRSLDLYFNPMPGSSGPASQKSSVSSIPATGSLVLADLVSTVYGQDAQLGSLQLRSPDVERLGVTATVFNKSNPAGSFGTTIPVFRSDRDVPPAERIFLTGLTRSDSRHTNLFLQETSGADVLVETSFLDAAGNVLGTRSDVVAPFAMVQLGNVAPEDAVSAVLTNAGETGEFVAYATPVDRLSGDTWAVSDWPRQLGYSRNESVVIPVVGALRGANETFFRTDVSLFATGSTATTGVLRYFDRTGPVFEETVTIESMSTLVLDNITESFFGIDGDTVGHMTFTPSAGEVVITSRNFTTVAGGEGTFGSGVPTLAITTSLAAGEIAHFAGISDATIETIQDGSPATFRTNFGFVETSGQPAKIRVVVRFSLPGTIARALVEADQIYDIAPNQFLLLSNLVQTITGASQLPGDVSNVEVRFEHLDGEGRVSVFTSSVDNGTGDSILRVE